MNRDDAALQNDNPHEQRFLRSALHLKRCRDLGHRKKYADKIKNDPVWLTYSRAYKAHYARFLKKKMTQAEFQVWADYALDLRQQALDGTIEFKTYMEEIRK